jgi:hypothetical protein
MAREKKHKLLKFVDVDKWNKFVGYAKGLGKNVTDVFEDLIEPIINNGEQKEIKKRGKKQWQTENVK